MKELVTRISLAGKEEEAVHPALQALKNRLIEQEVEPSLIQRLVREIAEESADGITPEKAAHAMKRKLVELLRSTGSDGCKAISPATRIAHFVGPTGVGKTTTIAKLAAEQVLKHKRKVGFITSDTYRIAAVEQLKTYATILNVPLEVVFSPQDLLKAFEKMTDRDIVFMDTAGRNFRNEMYVSELNALLSAENNGETFLVLSLTMKYKDMKAITENFMKFKLDKVLFTKMDETDSYGSIVNLLHDFPIRLSYVTTGQSVPDDIAEAKEEHIVDRILGDVAHG
jgi:flagellar biosynthesis protein FlhF